MIDWSNTFNIVFVSVASALVLFFLVTIIAVAAKGKRKCGAFDVIVRILASLVFVASTIMLACAVLTMLDGDVRIEFAPETEGEAIALMPVLVLGESITEMPISDLFALLATEIGFGLSAVLFLLSLAALIVDCLVANKKSDAKASKKNKKTKIQKTPEQIRREAEIERIRRIGESAVRKTSSVASSEKTERAENSDDEARADEPDYDWRNEPEPQDHTTFVGIKEQTGEFDSFDDFGEADGEQTEQTETEPAEVENGVDEAEFAFDVPQAAGVHEETTGDASAEQPDETDASYDDEEDNVEDHEHSEPEAEEQYDNTDEMESVDEPYETDDSDAAEQDVDDGYEDMSAWRYDEENADGDNIESDEAPADVRFEEPNIETDVRTDNTARTDAGIEPDRDIYIPEIRTVVRGGRKPFAQRTDRSATTKRTTSAKRPATQKTSAGKRNGQKQSGKKPTKQTAVKPSTGKATQTIPPEKKLPVTKRYVILDRHNAVNMFGEYLKERNKAEKDKLQSSINTIIIE